MKKKFLLLLIILVVFLSINVNAQWKQLDFTGGTTKRIVLLNDSLFVLSASGIYRSSDLGFNWTEVNNKEIIEKIDTLNSYQFFGEGNIFTCNNKLYFSKLNRLVYSTDYGNSWNRLYPPNSTLGTTYYSIKDSLFAYTFDSLILYKLINNQWEIVLKNKRGSDLFQTEPNNIFSYDYTRLNFPLLRSNNGVVYSEVFTKGLPIHRRYAQRGLQGKNLYADEFGHQGIAHQKGRQNQEQPDTAIVDGGNHVMLWIHGWSQSGKRWTVSGLNAGRHTATYSAPPACGVE